MYKNKVIRHSIFETNSSSTHSITITSGDDIFDNIKPDKNLRVELIPGEYGWEVETYPSAFEKACYAATWAKTCGKKEDVKLLKKVIKEHTGAKYVKIIKGGNDGFIGNGYGYIDHQSKDLIKDYFDTEELLKNFIFNKRFILHTDSDG